MPLLARSRRLVFCRVTRRGEPDALMGVCLVKLRLEVLGPVRRRTDSDGPFRLGSRSSCPLNCPGQFTFYCCQSKRIIDSQRSAAIL